MSGGGALKEMERYHDHHFIFIGGGPNHTKYRGGSWSTKRYRAVISSMLDDIKLRTSGKCLFDSLGKRVLIVPVHETTTNPGDLMGSATSVGSIDYVDCPGNFCNIANVSATGKTEALWDADAELAGEGSEYLVQFTPSFYDKSKQLAQSFAGDYKADSILFHELVHAARGTRGVFDETKLAGPLPIGDMRRYTNVDEFVAIMLENIYHSEKYRTLRLRASHSVTFEFYRNPRNFWKVQEFQIMMDLFAQQSPSLFWDFGHKVNAQWNPIRDYHKSTADQNCSLHGGR